MVILFVQPYRRNLLLCIPSRNTAKYQIGQVYNFHSAVQLLNYSPVIYRHVLSVNPLSTS